MSEPYVGEIRMLGFNFPPNGWALCNGAVLPIDQNEVLFALIGTTYGGDGVTTFALPNLQSRVPNSRGQGPGLSPYVVGESGGQESVTLIQNQLPAHNHVAFGKSGGGNARSPAQHLWASDAAGGTAPFSTADPDVLLAPHAIGLTGGNQPHENVPPVLAINFSIALFGIFPSQA